MTPLWYALHVKTRFERLVEMQLEKKGYEVFLPTYASSRNWSDRVKEIHLPLFPSYVFCRFHFDNRLPIIMTAGVNSVVGAGKTPISVSEGEIAAIRQALDSGMKTRPSPYIAEGEEVHIAQGPLKGLKGILVRSNGDDRLILSVTLLMRSISVEIDRAWIVPAVARAIHKSA